MNYPLHQLTDPRPQFCRMALWLVAIVCACSPKASWAQSHWELTPYRVKVVTALAPLPELGSYFAEDLHRTLRERARVTVGAAWEVAIEPAGVPVRHQMLRSLAAMPDDAFAEDWETHDKIVLLTASASGNPYRVAAREFDCTTRRWSTPVEREVGQANRLAETLFETWFSTFAPLAQVTGSEQGVATLQLRAAALVPKQSGFQQAELGTVFQPIVRRNGRDGTPQPDGIQPIPWTYLIAREADAQRVQCQIHSGVRNPLSIRRRGRIDLFALAVRGTGEPTELQLRSRRDTSQPLVGYDVYTQSPDGGEMERFGVTDRQGALSVPPTAEPLRMLYVKHGSRVLGRLPIVPGLLPVEMVQLAEDDERLRIEGQLIGLEESLIDVVARRELFFGRIRLRLDAGDAAGAAKLLDELRRLPTREAFAHRITQLENSVTTRDLAVQAEVARMLQRTRATLGKYLDSRPIAEIQSQIDRAGAR